MNTSVNKAGKRQSPGKTYALIVLTGLVLLLQNAHAQFTYIDTSMYVNIMRDSAFVSDMQKRYDQAVEMVDRNASPQTTFLPAPRLTVESFAASLGETPEEVQTLTATLTQGFDAFEQEAQRLERPHNVAMAFAYLVGVCYLVYHNEEPSETALLTLQASADATLGGSDSFKQLSDQQRQEFYETMVLLATLPFMGYLTASEQQDQAMMESYREVAASTLESILGMHPDQLLFTETGLELR